MLLFKSGLHELYLTSSVAGNIGARCNEGFVGLKFIGWYWFFGVGLVPRLFDMQHPQYTWCYCIKVSIVPSGNVALV